MSIPSRKYDATTGQQTASPTRTVGFRRGVKVFGMLLAVCECGSVGAALVLRRNYGVCLLSILLAGALTCLLCRMLLDGRTRTLREG